MSSISEKNTELLLDTAQLAALIVLENGGETSRAEEIATIICKSHGESAQAVAFPTGIFITVEGKDSHKLTSIARIRARNVNLYRVERANAYSRRFSSGEITLEELNDSLSRLKRSVIYSKTLVTLATGLCAAAFTLLFEEVLNIYSLFDMAVAFIASLTAQVITSVKGIKRAHRFTSTFVAAVVLAAISILGVSIFDIGDLNCILIGSIMPLLPGLSLTNAIRDTVMGDSVSGTVRTVETLLIAVALAGGVGISLAAYVSFFGGKI